MTRFARADGSKGSNKRSLEEATSWSEMVQQREKLHKSSKDNEEKNDTRSSKDDDDANFKSEKIDDQPEDLNLKKEEYSKTTVKPKNKKNKKDKKKTEGQVEFKIDDEGKRVKVFKDGKERPFYDLPYEESDRMTRYENFWVKVEAVDELEKLKYKLAAENNPRQNQIYMKAKRSAHNKLRIELIYEQRDILRAENKLKNPTAEVEKSTKHKKVKKEKEKKKIKFDQEDIKVESNNEEITEEKIIDQKYNNNQSLNNLNNPTKFSPNTSNEFLTNKSNNKKLMHKNFEFKFEENYLMTCYDGYWVRKAAVDKLNAMKTIRHKQIIDKRTNGDFSTELSKEEQIELNRMLKKEKRNEANKLKNDIKNNTVYSLNEDQYDGFDYYASKDINISNMVQFDGIWLKREAAERLQNLREKLKSEGIKDEEIADIIRSERRKEERSFKNANKVECFQCREFGHIMSQCPQQATGANAIPVMGICFKCGSTEHMSAKCTTKKEEYSFASCFICGQTGHISRSCPDNPKGLYPRGGCCKICSSVEHLAKDCPNSQEENQRENIKLGTIDGNALEALDDEPTYNFKGDSGGKKVIRFT